MYLLTYWAEKCLVVTKRFSTCKIERCLAVAKCFSTYNTERGMVAVRHFSTCSTERHSFILKVDCELYEFSKYTPPFMKKVFDKYVGMLDLYPKAKLEIWSLVVKGTSWVARLLNQLDTFIKFHFIKNGNQDSMKKMHVHDMKAWAHDLEMVVFVL